MSDISLVEFDEVSYRYGEGKRDVLSRISYAVKHGDRICITGRSGSGKTTLLNLAGGLQSPTSGVVRFEGHPWTRMSSSEKNRIRGHKVGFIFQSPNLIPVMTAFENVEFALEFSQPRLTSSARKQRVRDVLSITGLSESENSRPSHLSGGECQRLAVARAIVKTPILILADEPTSHLDDDNAAKIQEIFEVLNTDFGVAVITATHDQRISMRYELHIRLVGQVQPTGHGRERQRGMGE
jgi:putative ABC transport system ATP-binding protein